MKENNKLKNTWIYTAVVLFISWLCAGIFFSMGFELGDIQAFIFSIFYMFLPAISVVIVHKFILKEKESFKTAYKINFKPNKYFFAAWFLPLIISFITVGVSTFFPGVVFSPGMEGMFERFRDTLTPEQMAEMKRTIDEMPVHPVFITVIQGLIAGVTINAVAAFGEELGWRGFMLKETGTMGFWKSSLLIGFIWGIWHAPLILQGHNYPQHPQLGVLMMTVFCILYSPLFTYLTLKANSVIAAAILHGSINATAGFSMMLLKGGDDLIIGMTGFAGFIVLLIANFILYFIMKKEPVKQG